MDASSRPTTRWRAICKATDVIEHDAYGEVLGWWMSGGEELKVPRGPLARALLSGEHP